MSSIYLDNAATSFPKPDSVYAAADACLRRAGTAFGRGSHAATDEVGRLVSQCRQRIARLLDAGDPGQIAFSFNCTDGLNLLLRGLLRPDDRVVTTTLEHNSVLRPLEQLSSEFGLDLVHTPFDPDTGLINCEDLIAAIRARTTRLVVINHASNVTGVVQPVDLIVQAAHDAGALVLLDAAQTAGHLPLSLQHLKVDLLASAGHKGLLGPLGTGIVFVRRGLETELRPVRCGGTGTNSEQLQQPRHMPQKLESGNLNVPGLAGLDAAAQWILDRGVQELHQQIQTHTANLAAGLQQIPEVILSCWTQGGGGGQRQNTGIVSFNIGDLDCREVALMLDQSAGIQCRAGLHCAPLAHQTLGTFDRGGTVRFSPGPFTTDQQIAAAVDSVSQIAASFR